MLSADADLLCAFCFAIARQHATPFQPPPNTKAKAKAKESASEEELEEAYRVLRSSSSASDEEVRKAYKEACFKNHPDRKKSESAKANASNRFKEIQKAWSTISAARGLT